MNTPIYDFVSDYIHSDISRLHVPGHKGRGPLGCEARDITELAGADALYEADGIIAESEKNAAALFGTQASLYSCEGSSLCIRAMLYLALANREPSGGRPVALAARNAHKAFLFSAALCDFDVAWLYPSGAQPRPPSAAAHSNPADRSTNGLPPVWTGEGEGSRVPTAAAPLRPDNSICACPVTPEALDGRLSGMAEKPFCVYVTSPDYLGGMQDIAGLARVCHGHGVPLIVDNAHGAYLKFLPGSRHPIDLGADMCCDSAHKTLPVLTGGAYLHVAKGADPRYAGGAKQAMALFGSTSPSYLILQSLDLCNARLAGDFSKRLAAAEAKLDRLKRRLADRGFCILDTEPMKLTLRTDGLKLAGRLRAGGAECEYADREHVVMMFSADNRDEDLERVDRLLREPLPCAFGENGAIAKPARAMTIREAVFAASEVVPVREAVGRVCAAPTVACPPAVPVAVSGEIISPETVEVFLRNGIESVRVVRQS